MPILHKKKSQWYYLLITINIKNDLTEINDDEKITFLILKRILFNLFLEDE